MVAGENPATISCQLRVMSSDYCTLNRTDEYCMEEQIGIDIFQLLLNSYEFISVIQSSQ